MRIFIAVGFGYIACTAQGLVDEITSTDAEPDHTGIVHRDVKPENPAPTSTAGSAGGGVSSAKPRTPLPQ